MTLRLCGVRGEIPGLAQLPPFSCMGSGSELRWQHCLRPDPSCWSNDYFYFYLFVCFVLVVLSLPSPGHGRSRSVDQAGSTCLCLSTAGIKGMQYTAVVAVFLYNVSPTV